MNKIFSLTTVVLIIFFTGCGGKGGGTSTDSEVSVLSIDIADCPGTTSMLTGDEIVPDNSTTPVVKITELGDGTKDVCLESGDAHLER